MSDLEKRLEGLRELGFLDKNGAYVCEKPIIDGEMTLFIEVSKDGEIRTKIVDCDIGEEYTLHLSDSASGSFVGRVRDEYKRHLSSVEAVLLTGYRYGTGQSGEIVDYVSKKYGDELEFLWDDDNAIVRRKDTGKWYLALLVVQGTKIGLASEDKVEIIDLHAKTEDIETMVDGVRYFKGYHMNKKHWVTLVLDGRVPSEEIFDLIDKSYDLAKKK